MNITQFLTSDKSTVVLRESVAHWTIYLEDVHSNRLVPESYVHADIENWYQTRDIARIRTVAHSLSFVAIKRSFIEKFYDHSPMWLCAIANRIGA